MRVSSLILAALAVAAALPWAGCGPDGESTTSASSLLSKSQFLKRADAICEKADEVRGRRAVAYRARHEKNLEALSPVAGEERVLLAVGFPSALEQINEVRALGSPPGEEQKVKEILDELEAAARRARRHPYVVEGEEPWRKNPFHEPDIAARDYGFNACNNLF